MIVDIPDLGAASAIYIVKEEGVDQSVSSYDFCAEIATCKVVLARIFTKSAM